MLDSITIKNFKAITELTLSGLSNVNYLVGKNGCGKSSVLEAINLFLNLKTTNTNIFIPPTGSYNAVEILNQLIAKKDNNEPNFDIFGSDWKKFLFEIITEKTEINILLKNGIKDTLTFNQLLVSSFSNNCINFDASYLVKLENFDIELPDDNEIENDKLKLKKIVIEKLKIIYLNEIVLLMEGELKYQFEINGKTKDELEVYWDEIENTLPLDIKDEFTLSHQQSNGKNSLKTLFYGLLHIITVYRLNTLFIEEPEMYLHPQYQKCLPKFFDAINKVTKTQFIISTHSPFIISAAAELQESQKVYLIDEGHTVDINQINNKRGNVGYSGSDCVHTASKMLGSSIQDFAPSKIVFGEKSVCTFLKIINSRFYNKNIQFKPVVNTSTKTGDSTESASDFNIVSLFEKYEEIYKLGDNLYEKIELNFIIDTPPIHEKQKIKSKLKAHKKLSTFVFKEEELEKIYLQEIVKKYNSTAGGSKKKQELAKFVANEISQLDFEKIEVYNNYGINEIDSKPLYNLIFT
jgi:AAA15 family ATPase/GTPase